MQRPPEAALERACTLVRDAADIAAFTGAGISAESGIPTYRDSADSIWQKYDATRIANIDFFMRDPTEYWRFFRDARYKVMAQAQPNPGHQALAAMERAGKLRCLITQNIDGLHQLAGSQQVIELHGNTRRIKCLQCGEPHGFDDVYEILRMHNPPPCKACGGMLKPEVVFFGEALPPEALAAAEQAAHECDLLISIGSSLVVYPAAFLPELAKLSGARLIIINKTPTGYDAIADAVLPLAAGEALPVLARAAGAEVQPA